MTLELTLKIKYVPNGTSVADLRSNLENLVSIGMEDGLITGDTTAEVETYSSNIKEI